MQIYLQNKSIFLPSLKANDKLLTHKIINFTACLLLEIESLTADYAKIVKSCSVALALLITVLVLLEK